MFDLIAGLFHQRSCLTGVNMLAVRAATSCGTAHAVSSGFQAGIVGQGSLYGKTRQWTRGPEHSADFDGGGPRATLRAVGTLANFDGKLRVQGLILERVLLHGRMKP